MTIGVPTRMPELEPAAIVTCCANAPVGYEITVVFTFAEVAPKTFAVQHAERAAMRVSGLLAFLTRFPPLRLLTRGFIGVANVVLPGKGLRGGPLDIFGMTAERKMERGLLADYEAGLSKLAAGLTSERLETAVRIAAIPQKIRGFGHVKEASVGPAKAEEKALWGRWDKQAAKVLEPA